MLLYSFFFFRTQNTNNTCTYSVIEPVWLVYRLHDALLRKSGQDFWKIWNSKFDRKVIHPLNVGGIIDDKIIADNFATHFEKVCTPSRVYDDLLKEYNEKRLKYDEPLYGSRKVFSVEQIGKMFSKFEKWKSCWFR